MNENPIWNAINGKRYDEVLSCLETTDINECDKTKNTLLHNAVNIKSIYLTSLFISKSCDINARNIKGRTPLFLAVINYCNESSFNKDNERIIECLFENGADQNLPDNNGDYPLTIAMDLKSGTIIDILLTKIDVNYRNSKGETFLHMIIRKSYDKAISLPENKWIKEFRWGEYLCLECNGYNQYVLRRLIKKGADPTLCDNSGNSPLDIALHLNFFDVVETLLKSSIPILLDYKYKLLRIKYRRKKAENLLLSHSYTNKEYNHHIRNIALLEREENNKARIEKKELARIAFLKNYKANKNIDSKRVDTFANPEMDVDLTFLFTESYDVL